MAITISTASPAALLANIKAAIKDGRIKTWSVDDDGDFTHTADLWRYRAWLRPRVEISQLRFYILAPRETTISKVIYAVYHSRFIEAILSHFDEDAKSFSASSMPEGDDQVTS